MTVLAHYLVGRLPRTTIVGLTGSSGKTSTKDFIGQMLARLRPDDRAGRIVQQRARSAAHGVEGDRGHEWLVLEMGARGIGHIRDLCDIATPHIGIVVNVGVAHIGEFGSVEAIAIAKGELVEALPPDGVAVLNADDPRSGR